MWQISWSYVRNIKWQISCDKYHDHTWGILRHCWLSNAGGHSAFLITVQTLDDQEGMVFVSPDAKNIDFGSGASTHCVERKSRLKVTQWQFVTILLFRWLLFDILLPWAVKDLFCNHHQQCYHVVIMLSCCHHQQCYHVVIVDCLVITVSCCIFSCFLITIWLPSATVVGLWNSIIFCL